MPGELETSPLGAAEAKGGKCHSTRGIYYSMGHRAGPGPGDGRGLLKPPGRPPGPSWAHTCARDVPPTSLKFPPCMSDRVVPVT